MGRPAVRGVLPTQPAPEKPEKPDKPDKPEQAREAGRRRSRRRLPHHPTAIDTALTPPPQSAPHAFRHHHLGDPRHGPRRGRAARVRPHPARDRGGECAAAAVPVGPAGVGARADDRLAARAPPDGSRRDDPHRLPRLLHRRDRHGLHRRAGGGEPGAADHRLVAALLRRDAAVGGDLRPVALSTSITALVDSVGGVLRPGPAAEPRRGRGGRHRRRRGGALPVHDAGGRVLLARGARPVAALLPGVPPGRATRWGPQRLERDRDTPGPVGSRAAHPDGLHGRHDRPRLHAPWVCREPSCWA